MNNIQLIRDSLKSLSVKVEHLIKDEETANAVCDLIGIARFLLKSQVKPKPEPGPIARVRRYDPSDDGDDSQVQEEIDPEEQREHSKRSLKDKWAGPLEAIKKPKTKQKRIGIDVDQNGISGPDPDNYETAKGNPGTKCPQCQVPIYQHTYDRQAQSDENGFKPFIACDWTRVYCGCGPDGQ